MTRRKKLLLGGGILAAVAAAVAFFMLPGVLFDRAVWHSIHEQQLLLEGATPLFDTVIAQQLKVGDSLDHAKKVLTDAGQEFDVDSDYPSGRKLQSICRVGRGAAFVIELHLDSQDHIAKIDITKTYTGP
jgi:hypothetical protein